MIFLDKIGHLISDRSLDELHLFANQIGLKREWFQDKPGQPHYDLTTSRMRFKAELSGAVMTDPKTIVWMLKEAPYNIGK